MSISINRFLTEESFIEVYRQFLGEFFKVEFSKSRFGGIPWPGIELTYTAPLTGDERKTIYTALVNIARVEPGEIDLRGNGLKLTVRANPVYYVDATPLDSATLTPLENKLGIFNRFSKKAVAIRNLVTAYHELADLYHEQKVDAPERTIFGKLTAFFAQSPAGGFASSKETVIALHEWLENRENSLPLHQTGHQNRVFRESNSRIL